MKNSTKKIIIFFSMFLPLFIMSNFINISLTQAANFDTTIPFITSDSVKIKLQAFPSDVVGFHFYLFDHDQNQYTQSNNTVTITDPSAIFTGLNPGTQYKVTVFMVTTKGSTSDQDTSNYPLSDTPDFTTMPVGFVPDPIATPVSSAYVGAQSVSLAYPVSTALFFIHYTVDGTTPDCATSGSRYTNPIPVTTTTTIKAITCNESDTHWSNVVSFVYTITNPLPSIDFSASPDTINAGDSSTLTWAVTNANTCVASGDWSGSKNISDSFTVSPAATATYTLSCTGAGGTASQDVTVTVNISSPPVTTPPATTTNPSPDSASNLIPCGLDDANGHVTNPCQFSHLFDLINNVVKFVLFKLVVPIAAIMFAYAGILLVTAGEDSSGAREKAKKIFTDVLIGLIVAMAAWLIVELVLMVLGYNSSWPTWFGF